MASTYYLGQTASGLTVARMSRMDYGYTHGAINASGRTSFGTSYEGCRSNAEGILGSVYEVAEVRVVDRKTFMAATKAPVAPVELPELPVPTSAPATREAWLLAFTEAARPMFVHVGAELAAQVASRSAYRPRGHARRSLGSVGPPRLPRTVSARCSSCRVSKPIRPALRMC